MEQQNSNTNYSPVLCRGGCGFYGSSSMDGMCSKCYKEALNRKMQPPSPPTSGSQTSTPAPAQISNSVATAAGGSEIRCSSSSSVAAAASASSSFRDLSLNSSSPVPVPVSSSMHLSSSIPAFSTTHLAKPGSSTSLAESLLSDSALSSSPSASSLPSSYDPSSSPLGLSDSAKKKNRCAECNKRVGLTGFECRCGGMFCPLHRYSDMHKCSFDYKQMGAEEVRKNNPAVRAEKVQKL